MDERIIVKRVPYKMTWGEMINFALGLVILLVVIFSLLPESGFTVALRLLCCMCMVSSIAQLFTYLMDSKIVDTISGIITFAFGIGIAINQDMILSVYYNGGAYILMGSVIILQIIRVVKLRNLVEGEDVVQFDERFIRMWRWGSNEFLRIKWTEIKDVSFKSKGCNKIYLNIKKEYRELYCEKTILGFRKNYVTIMGESIDTEFRALGEKIQGRNYHKNCDQMEKRIEEHVGRN